MEKLSEKLREKKRQYWADADDSPFMRSQCADKAEAFEEAAQLAETYEAENEKRIAELEKRLRTVAEALRELSPGPHPGPMNAEDYVPLVGNRLTALQRRVVELEAQSDRTDAEICKLDARIADLSHYHAIAMRDCEELAESNRILKRDLEINEKLADSRYHLIKSLQSQLAWTPVNAGLPTEPGVYEFVTLTLKCALFDLDVDGQWWTHARGDGTAPENLLDDTYWQSFRRIELPEAP